jgi:hypothetical protein
MAKLLLISTITLLAPSALAAGLNVTGEWTYATSGSWKKGPCPTGGDAKGTLKMTQKGAKVTLVFKTGRTCRPASMCVFAGKLKGKVLVLSNSAKVDNEGGKASNTIKLKLKDADHAAGSSSSSYKHPGGMVCSWGSKVTLQRKKK